VTYCMGPYPDAIRHLRPTLARRWKQVSSLGGADERLGNGPLALENTTLAVAGGEVVALLGPSGCGP
jgi:ABC-type taurine transport system ATPase subunit